MKPRNKFIDALERKPVEGRVPHFELAFFLSMEAFGKVHPLHRSYRQWDQMSNIEKQMHRREMAEIFIRTAEEFGHSAIFLHPNPSTIDETNCLIDIVREITGDKYFLMLHGDATFGIPSGKEMLDFSLRLRDEPEKVKEEAGRKVDEAIKRADRIKNLDGFALCADYCFSDGPFLSPSMFSEFVAPYLAKLVKEYREMGFYTIKHTDGNIMPILDQILQSCPHALHSLDPQAGIDIKEIKRIAGDKICLIGNVNCGLLQTGTEEQVVDSAKYALQNGMPGYGYIFSTSNCIYTGMPFERYKLMLEVWKKFGNYSQ